MDWKVQRRDRKCLLCGAPLRDLRWWEIFGPPPLCLVDKEGCHERMKNRLGLTDE